MRHGAILLLAIIVLAGAAGFVVGKSDYRSDIIDDGLTIAHGLQSKEFFDTAYDRIDVDTEREAIAGLSAHHLLIPDKIAEVFATFATKKSVTLVLVSPNHFSVGISAAQTTVGTWATPYGDVEVDDVAIDELLSSVSFLRLETLAFPNEHGIAALTPFVARSLPNAKIVPIILDESLASEDAWALGETIARELPDAILIASIDMTHYQDAEYTAENDAQVMALLDSAMECAATHCGFDFDIDSNASLRTLLGFVYAKGGGEWRLTHHGSSLEMGATTKPADNTSHILGYFLELAIH